MSKARMAAVGLGAAAAALAAGGLFILVALGRGLAVLFNWPVWAGYGLLGVILAVIGYALLTSARRQLRMLRPMPRTVETMKEHVEWARSKSARG